MKVADCFEERTDTYEAYFVGFSACLKIAGYFLPNGVRRTGGLFVFENRRAFSARQMFMSRQAFAVSCFARFQRASHSSNVNSSKGFSASFSIF